MNWDWNRLSAYEKIILRGEKRKMQLLHQRLGMLTRPQEVEFWVVLTF